MFERVGLVGMIFSNKFKSDKFRFVMSALLILIGVILTINTNNNPVPFIEKIFRPVEKGSGTLHYGGIIVIILIYNGVRGIRNYGKGKFLFLTKHPFVTAIVILVLSSGLNTNVIKIYKSFSPGLNSIYCDREVNGLSIKYNENGQAEIDCTLKLTNYSSGKRVFYTKIIIPDYYSEAISEKELFAVERANNTHKKFVLEGNQTKIIQILFIGGISKDKENAGYFTSYTKNFEFELFNDKEAVNFLEIP